MKKLLLVSFILFSFLSCVESDNTGKVIKIEQSIQKSDDERKAIDVVKSISEVSEQVLDEFKRSDNYNPNYESQVGNRVRTLCNLTDNGSLSVSIATNGNGCYYLACGSTNDDECHGALWAQWNCFWHGID